ncbi:hypothetical protein [Halomonas sp. JS92-SW72]|uniref:hypothetical protein n=1 Tax=Halomonas sp. JS92-SW72 TaxID=2306583 RepID=UPI000E5A8C8B|nr:hypothetical protein [Halomonas sp. JS92-SW72]AXY41621.1 hypothetical protein D1793_05100 [Halomonas sp. JS92-SW72]
MQFDETEFSKLSTKADRARYLLRVGVTARLTIDPEKLHPAYVPKVGDILMASLCGYFDSEEGAIEAGTKRLQDYAGEEVCDA